MKFSIIIPVYNSAPYLRECLDSLFAQDLPGDECEIVAVNDGSPDGSPAILREYALKHPGRFVIINQANAGPGPARNAGFAASRGDCVWFADADDAIPRGALAAVAGAFKTTGAEIVCVDYAEFVKSPPRARQHAGAAFPVSPYSPAAVLCLENGAVWNKVFCRGLLERANVAFPSLRGPEDMAETYRIAAHAGKVVKIRDVCYFYRQSPGSLVRVCDERKMLDFICAAEMLKKQVALFPGLHDEYKYLLWKNLRWTIRHVNTCAARGGAASRAAAAAHLPALLEMFREAEDLSNPYIGIAAKLAGEYENSLSWKTTKPLRWVFDKIARMF